MVDVTIGIIGIYLAVRVHTKIVFFCLMELYNTLNYFIEITISQWETLLHREKAKREREKEGGRRTSGVPLLNLYISISINLNVHLHINFIYTSQTYITFWLCWYPENSKHTFTCYWDPSSTSHAWSVSNPNHWAIPSATAHVFFVKYLNIYIIDFY